MLVQHFTTDISSWATRSATWATGSATWAAASNAVSRLMGSIVEEQQNSQSQGESKLILKKVMPLLDSKKVFQFFFRES